jgi:hypothetical protein
VVRLTVVVEVVGGGVVTTSSLVHASKARKLQRCLATVWSLSMQDRIITSLGYCWILRAGFAKRVETNLGSRLPSNGSLEAKMIVLLHDLLSDPVIHLCIQNEPPLRGPTSIRR